MKSLAIIMAFCLIFAIMPQNEVHSYNNVLYVGGHGEGNYSSIQAAINAALPGYTIFVYPGVYKENLYINKSISLIGENRETTIIDGCHKGFVVRINASNVTIKNFTIRNSGYSYASIYITSNGNCIVGNKIEFGNGISLYKSNNNVIEKNVFATLNGSYPCTAIFMKYSSNNTINGNKIESKDMAMLSVSSFDSIISGNEINGTGIIVQQCENFKIVNNSIKNGDRIGIEIVSSKNIEASKNRIYNITGTIVMNDIATPAGAAIIAGYSYGVSIEGNVINSTNFTGVAMSLSKKCVITDNKILNICGVRKERGAYPTGTAIILEFCDDSIVKKNFIENANFGGISIIFSKNNSIEENKLFNISGYEMVGHYNGSTAIGIAILYAENISVKENFMGNSDNGAIAVVTQAIEMNGNKLINISGYIETGGQKQKNGYGIALMQSKDCIISNNVFHNNFYSIYAAISANLSILGNEIRSDEIEENGITLYMAIKGKILDNDVNDAIIGILLFSSKKIEIKNNSLQNTLNLLLLASNRNKIMGNEFIKKQSMHAFFINSALNLWLRNYWSNWRFRIPKPVFGIKISKGMIIPWLNFDWMPISYGKNFSMLPLFHSLINQSASFPYHILQFHLPQLPQFYEMEFLEMHHEILLHLQLQQPILYCSLKKA